MSLPIRNSFSRLRGAILLLLAIVLLRAAARSIISGIPDGALQAFSAVMPGGKRSHLISSRRSLSPSDPETTSTSSTEAASLPRTFTDGLPLPRVFVFDLDYTIWPFWVDTHVTPPLKASPSAPGLKIKDRYGDSYGFYPEVPTLLAALRARGCKIAAASRTCTPDLARDMLKLLTVKDEAGGGSKPAKTFFDNLQIYPGDKVRHMKGIKKDLDCTGEEMIFFDDEERNSNTESAEGVCFCLVGDGVGFNEIDKGVGRWRKMHSKTKKTVADG